MFDNSAILALFSKKTPENVTVTPESEAVTAAIVTATNDESYLKSDSCGDGDAAVTAVTVVTGAIVTATKSANPLKSITYDNGNDGNGGNGQKQHPRDKFFFLK